MCFLLGAKRILNIFCLDLVGYVTVVHFHGPADEFSNNQVRVTLDNVGPDSAMGEIAITPEFREEVLNETWYLNVHSDVGVFAANGEIRGQVRFGPGLYIYLFSGWVLKLFGWIF